MPRRPGRAPGFESTALPATFTDVVVRVELADGAVQGRD